MKFPAEPPLLHEVSGLDPEVIAAFAEGLEEEEV